MDYKDICSIGDVLRRTIEETNMQARLDELRAEELWHLIVGDYVASLTGRPMVRSGVMTVRLTDAPMRNELAMHRTRLVNEINRLIGKEIIKSIRFTG